MKYTPIFVEPPLQASGSDMHCLTWKKNGIQADFFIPGKPDQMLRINFEDVDIVRILDEMPISIEDYGEKQGMISEHFAYTVSDSIFEKSQSQFFLELRAPIKHFRFITGWTCLDVMSSDEPVFSVVPLTES